MDDVYIEQELVMPPTSSEKPKPLLYNLRDSKDLLCFYSALMEIRDYGCGTFHAGARSGVAKRYAEMADTGKWPSFGKGFNPVFMASVQADKDAHTQAKRAKTMKEKAMVQAAAGNVAQAAAGNAAAVEVKKPKRGGSSKSKKNDDDAEYTP